MATLTVDAHVEQRYDIQRHVGSGAYGVVWCAYDKLAGRPVALKKVYDAFGNKQDAQRIYREVMLLRCLRGNSRVVQLLNVMRADNELDLYLVFELAETDLTVVLRKHILVDVQRRYILYQLTQTVAELHDCGVLHRDIKPSNVFVYSDCSIKLGDFGLARTVGDVDDPDCFVDLTDYIATRWYRSPEILARSTVYTTAMDMWALGCVIAEVLLARPLFPGKSTAHQLSLIISAVGNVTKEDVESLNASQAWALMDALPSEVDIEPLTQRLEGCDGDAVDLVSRLLVFNPSRRLTARQALRHAYFADFVTERDVSEPAHTRALSLPLSDRQQLTAAEYKQALYDAVAKVRMRNYGVAGSAHSAF